MRIHAILLAISAFKGYAIDASDGRIGTVSDFLFDDESWVLQYLIVDTRDWWPGKHVLLSPHAVQDISYLDRKIRLTVSRELVMASPP